MRGRQHWGRRINKSVRGACKKMRGWVIVTWRKQGTGVGGCTVAAACWWIPVWCNLHVSYVMFCIRDRKSHGPPRLSAFQTYGLEVSEKKNWIFVCGKVGRTKKGENLKNSLFYRIRLMWWRKEMELTYSESGEIRNTVSWKNLRGETVPEI